MAQNSNQLDVSIERVDRGLDKLQNSLDTALRIANVVQNIAQINADIKMMDMQMQVYLKNADVKLESFKTVAAVISKELDRCSDRVDLTLDRALSIDTKTATSEEIQLRGELLNSVNNWSDTISNLMMKLMTY